MHLSPLMIHYTITIEMDNLDAFNILKKLPDIKHITYTPNVYHANMIYNTLPVYEKENSSFQGKRREIYNMVISEDDMTIHNAIAYIKLQIKEAIPDFKGKIEIIARGRQNK